MPYYKELIEELESSGFPMVIDNGRDIDMQQICGCANQTDEFVTMDWCEKNCAKYYSCDNIAIADDILKVYEGRGDELLEDEYL